jgi:DNA replication factor GINS
MDMDELLLILEKCKAGKLQKINDNLYANLKERIKELEEMRKTADENEILRIEDEIRTLKRIQKKIFEARTGKIVRAAWAEICGASVSGDLENMIEKEKELFRKLVDVIKEFKKWVEESKEEVKEGRKGEYMLIRIKSDIPEFQGVDGKTYKLRREDVITLPTLNAKALIKGGVAEEITVKDVR